MFKFNGIHKMRKFQQKRVNAMKIYIISILTIFINIGCEQEKTQESEDLLPVIFNNSLKYETITDIDGNNYKTIKIGNQVWMAENLRTTTLSDGSKIANTPDLEKLQNPSYLSYQNNTNPSFIAIYGYLYNLESINSGKLAPDGWRIPNQEDWETLIAFLGDKAGGKLKESGFIHWNQPNTGGNNLSGFTALGAGYRNQNGDFLHLKTTTSFWTNAMVSPSSAYIFRISDNFCGITKNIGQSNEAYSVRCIKN